MKVCPNCGAYQSDGRTTCVDCGERLGKPIPEKEEDKIREEVSNEMEKQYQRKNPLAVSILDKAVGIVALIGAALTVVLCFLGFGKEILAGTVAFLVAAAEALLPQLGWAVEKFRMSFTADNTDDLMPSSLYFIGRKIVIWGFTAVGIILVVFLLTADGTPAADMPQVIIR